MLRLTRTTSPAGRVVLKAEGQIVGEYVALLAGECRGMGGRNGGVILDLAGVSYLDRDGVRLLRDLSADQVSLVNCPPLVEDLLTEEEL
jgi:anti-anti-sigma regulatory factor